MDNSQPTAPQPFTPAPNPQPSAPQPPSPSLPPAPVANNDDGEKKSYFAAFLLALFMLPLGVSRAYLGTNYTWVKVALAAYIALFIPFLNLIAAPVLIVLLIVGFIDLFKVYGLRNNLATYNLSAGVKDLKYSKILLIVYLVIAAIYVLVAIAIIALIVAGVLQIDESGNLNTVSAISSTLYR